MKFEVEVPEIAYKMFKISPPESPVKSQEDFNMEVMITPPTFDKANLNSSTSSTDTPVSNDDMNGSYTEVRKRPLGRFHSFDVKRSLFSTKRFAEEKADTHIESTASKRLRETESALEEFTLKSPTYTQCQVKTALNLLSTNQDLIADSSRPYTLPTVQGKHHDLKSITPDTMKEVMSGCYSNSFDKVTIIDCRYPYEFEGGHIQGALNLYTREAIQEFLLQNSCSSPNQKHILVFHCEFSSERGPRMFEVEVPEIAYKMFKISPPESPVKSQEDFNMEVMITPPTFDKANLNSSTSSTDTPVSNDDMNGSYTEVRKRPLGRFHSFDVKRSLFSTKRFAEEKADTHIESTASKRLRETESALEEFTLKSPTYTQCQVKTALNLLSTNQDLIADSSRPYTLPTVQGKHHDLKSITPDTMKEVMSGCYSNSFDKVTIIDCRYPYEFEGGHIQGALNLYTREAIQEFLLQNSCSSPNQKHILVFHCEFSSERGPRMYRYLRSQDRAMNKDNYPRLNFPEIYLLDGGYKAFFNSQQTLCEPQTYLPMLHKDYSSDLRRFRAKSKSWTAGEKIRTSSRLTLRF